MNAGFRLASSSRSTALAASRSAKASRTPRRHIHMRKKLPYNIEDGLEKFMSPETLRMVAVEYQQGLLDRLNQECRSVEDRRKTVAQIVLDTARTQDRAVMFNYASHALNNSFFLHSLRPPSEDNGEKRIDASVFGTSVQKQFGGLDSLRSLISAAVSGMAGSGYVWLATDAQRNIAFLPTFASGTLLIRSGAGTIEPITAPVLGEESFSNPTPHTPSSGASYTPPQSLARSFHTSVSAQDDYKTRARSFYDSNGPSPSFLGPKNSNDVTTLGDYIYPLFCISVHEHCWLRDHGIWGKENYLREFWTVVDWNQVVNRFENFTAPRI